MHLGFTIYIEPVREFLRVLAAGVMERTERREQTVHEPLRDFPLGIENRGVGHEVADVSDEQQAAAGQRQGAAIGCREHTTGIQPAGWVLPLMEGVR